MLRMFSPHWDGRISVPRWLPWLIILGAVVMMLPVFYIGIYNHPCPFDDYQNAQWDDFFGIQRNLYTGWSGRYFNNLAVTLCPLHWRSLSGYRIAVICIMVVFAIAYVWLIIRFLRAGTDAPMPVVLAIATAATALLFNNFPSLAEAFFWYSSEVTYILPAAAALFLFALLIRVDSAAYTSGQRLLAAGVLAAAAIGGNETLLLLCNVAVGGCWLFYRMEGRPAQRRFYARLLLICGICSAVAILAPGNFARQAVNPRNTLMVVPTWLYHSQKTLFAWATNPYFLLWSVLVLLLAGAWPLRWPRLPLLAAFMLPVVVLLLLTLPAHYGLGTVPPPRVMNVVYAFFLLAWLIFLLHLNAYIAPMLSGAAQLRQAIIILLIIGLLAGINTRDLRRANLFTVPKSLVRRIPQAYDAELKARYRLMAASPQDTVALAPLVHWQGNVLYLADIIPIRTSRTNAYYAQYWGAKAVYLDTAGKR